MDNNYKPESQQGNEGNEGNEMNAWTVVRKLKEAIKTGDLSKMTEASQIFATEEVIFDAEVVETLGFLKARALSSNAPAVADIIDKMIKLSNGDISLGESLEKVEEPEGSNEIPSAESLKERFDSLLSGMEAQEQQSEAFVRMSENDFFSNLTNEEFRHVIDAANLFNRMGGSLEERKTEIEGNTSIDNETLEQWREAGLSEVLLQEFQDKINESTSMISIYDRAFAGLTVSQEDIDKLEQAYQMRLSHQEQIEASEKEEMDLIPETFIIIEEKGGEVSEILRKSVHNRTPHEQNILDLEVSRVQRARMQEKRNNLE